MTTHWHTGNNMPGYLPDSDDAPHPFEDFAAAKAAMTDDLDRVGDSIFDAGTDEDERAVADDYSAAMEELNLDTGPEWGTILPTSTSPHDLGRHYWIVSCDEDCETDE